jgi:hypothetical protein
MMLSLLDSPAEQMHDAVLRHRLSAAPSQPLLVRRALDCASALTSAHMRRLCADAVVAVSVADREHRLFSGTVVDSTRIDVPFVEFLDRFDAAASGAPIGSTVAYYLAQAPIYVHGQTGPPPALSALCELVTANNRLVDAATDCFGAMLECNLWMSLDDETRTSAHFDEKHGWLCVAAGRKTVRLGSPLRNASYRPHSVVSESANHSRLASDDACFEVSVELGPGDCLFVPENWWHSVTSAPCTVALNFWFGGRVQALVTSDPALAMSVCRRVLREITAERVSRLLASIAASPIADDVDALASFFADDCSEMTAARVLWHASATTFEELLSRAAALARFDESKLTPLIAKALVSAMERHSGDVDDAVLHRFVVSLGGGGDALAGEKRLLRKADELSDTVLLHETLSEVFGVLVLEKNQLK